MALPDGLGEMKGGLVHWGVPLVGGLVGVVLGDVIGLGKFLAGVIPVQVPAMGMGLLVAAGYAVAGAFLWGRFGIIGRFAGALFIGMAVGQLYTALTGKAIQIPGFSGVG